MEAVALLLIGFAGAWFLASHSVSLVWVVIVGLAVLWLVLHALVGSDPEDV